MPKKMIKIKKTREKRFGGTRLLVRHRRMGERTPKEKKTKKEKKKMDDPISLDSIDIHDVGRPVEGTGLSHFRFAVDLQTKSTHTPTVCPFNHLKSKNRFKKKVNRIQSAWKQKYCKKKKDIAVSSLLHKLIRYPSNFLKTFQARTTKWSALHHKKKKRNLLFLRDRYKSTIKRR